MQNIFFLYTYNAMFIITDHSLCQKPTSLECELLQKIHEISLDANFTTPAVMGTMPFCTSG